MMVGKKIHKNNLLMIYLCFEFLKLLYRVEFITSSVANQYMCY